MFKALWLGPCTARRKSAALKRPPKIRHRALHRLERSTVRPRQRTQERLRIRMLRMGKKCFCRRHFDNFTRIHPENRGIYTQSDSPKKSSRNIWSLAVVSVDQRY